jgi:energy-coupling factor transporter ATP-binding protein EcfA2
MTDAVIAGRGVFYRYPLAEKPVLQDLDFTIDAGEFVLLAGASGSGKSTLCRLLNGLIPHLHGGELHGHLTVAGADPRLTPPSQLSRNVGLLLQRPDAQCLAATVARDIALGPACQGLDRITIAHRVREVVNQLDIVHLLDRSPHTLSCGEQQRVALAGVLAMGPKLLALDEPFAFLDAAGAAQLRELLRRLHDSGITIIVAEHRLGELVDLASRMLVLHRGGLVADDSPATVLAGDISVWGLEQPGSLPALPPLLASATGEPIIEWDSVGGERSGRSVLKGASLTSRSGEIVALLGANGAGKSTLLRHGNGLLRAQCGAVRVQGQPVGLRPVAELASEVGLVMQQPAHMLFALTVRAELAAGPRALGRHDPAWCEQLSRRFGLTALLDRPPHTLSAGEQRRLAIAAVLASRPRALLLDEPTAGQDALARAALRTLLTECAAEGVAIVVATHDAHWAGLLCHRGVVLADGRIHDVRPLTSVDLPSEAGELKGCSARAISSFEGDSGKVEQLPLQCSSSQELARGRRFDPRAQSVVYLLYCALILLAMQPQELLPLLAVPLSGIALRRHWAEWRRAMGVLWPTLLLFAAMVGVGSGVEAATGAVLRLVALVTASVLFFALTPPEELGESLLASGLSPQAAFLLEGTLRFAPTMAALAREVREAQESRGIRLDGFYLLRNGVALLGPLLASVMRFADDLAEALEARGFGGSTRTPLADYRFRVRDWALIFVAVLMAFSGWLNMDSSQFALLGYPQF